MFHKFPLRSLIASWLLIGLLVAGCAAPVTSVSRSSGATTPIKVPSLPSLVPTIVKSVTDKTAAQPTASPTKAPTAAPTAMPAPKPTVAAATQPTQTISTFGKAEQLGDLSVLPQQIKRITQSGQDKPKTGDVYVLVTLAMTNTSKVDSVQFDPATFMLQDAAKHKTYPVVTLKSLPDVLTAQMLKPGETLQGRLAFEVPETVAARLELELSTASHTLYWTSGA